MCVVSATFQFAKFQEVAFESNSISILKNKPAWQLVCKSGSYEIIHIQIPKRALQYVSSGQSSCSKLVENAGGVHSKEETSG